jgi:hypothetical protein
LVSVREALQFTNEKQELERAKEELEERHHEIEVTVDGKVKREPRGTYLMATFKTLVGVAADRELDILKDGVLHRSSS